MAERFQPPPPPLPIIVAPTVTTNNNQSPSPPNRPQRIDDDKVALQIVIPGSKETYVVHMPKDRVYRVPPPENAAFVERMHAPSQKKTPRCRFPPCVFYTALILFAVAILTLSAFLIYKFTLSPKSPLFTIMSFSVNESSNPNPKSASAHHAPPTYKVGIEATNPNSVNSLVYMAGTTELLLGGKEVAKGHSPAITQAGKQIDDFEVALPGRDETVPTAVRKKGVKLNLTMSLHMKKKTWLMNHNDLVVVKCEFVVSSVSSQKDSATIKSQSCNYF